MHPPDLAEEGERQLPAHGGERLAVKDAEGQGGLGVRLKQRGLGHRQVHPRLGLLSAASPGDGRGAWGQDSGASSSVDGPPWGPRALGGRHSTLSHPITLSCQSAKASGYGQTSGPASQPRTNSDPLQLGTEQKPSPTRDKPRPQGRVGIPWEGGAGVP